MPVLPDGVRAIPLTQGKFALVDEADYPDLIRHSWNVKRGGGKPGHLETFYAMQTVIIRTTKAKGSVMMHRQIMGAKPGQGVDHINHNGLAAVYVQSHLYVSSCRAAGQRTAKGSAPLIN